MSKGRISFVFRKKIGKSIKKVHSKNGSKGQNGYKKKYRGQGR